MRFTCKTGPKTIISFRFSNFRSIHEPVELSFEASRSEDLEEYYVVRPTPKLRLLKMAAIYGANASGKSNVVEALDFLRLLVLNPVRKKTDAIVYDRFAFTEQQTNSTFELNFVHQGTRYDYAVTLNPAFIVSETLHFYQPNKALVFSRTTDPENQLSTIETGSKIKLAADDRKVLEASVLWNNTVLGGFLKVNVEFEELREVGSWFFQNITAVINPKSDLHPFIAREVEGGV